MSARSVRDVGVLLGLQACNEMLCYLGMRALCGARAVSGSVWFCSDEVTVAFDAWWVACLHACKNTEAKRLSLDVRKFDAPVCRDEAKPPTSPARMFASESSLFFPALSSGDAPVFACNAHIAMLTMLTMLTMLPML